MLNKCCGTLFRCDFYAAVNRAMNTVSDNAVVAVLSTSALLLHANTAATSVFASSTESAKTAAGDVNRTDVPESASDVFVGYERIKDAYSSLTSSMAVETTENSHRPSAGGSGTPGSAVHGRAGGEARDNQHRNGHQQGNVVTAETLLVTSLPSHVATSRQGNNVDDVVHPAEGERGDGHGKKKELEGTGRARLEAPSTVERHMPGKRLSQAASLPLLVFDVETFRALGELDERFSFQGGIAEWISRAELRIMGLGKENAAIGGICCDQHSPRRRKPPGRMRAASCRATCTGSCFDGAVQHVHEREWGRRFLRSWPGEGASTADDSQASEDVTIDQFTRLSPASLEALIQADADLFFLPFLLSSASPGEPAFGNLAQFGKVGIGTLLNAPLRRSPDCTRNHMRFQIDKKGLHQLSLIRSPLPRASVSGHSVRWKVFDSNTPQA